MPTLSASIIDFYDRHPINEAQVLAALARDGRDPRSLRPEDLYAWDQDHYGGLSAVEALARRAEIGAGSLVLDVCAGLGGPARFIARRFGCRVTGVDLNRGRCAAGKRLSALVKLDPLVRMVNGDARSLPFRRGAFTAVVSQEGLLHVPDKAAALGECARVLTPGGRMAFSDWVATPRLGDGERRRLEAWMAATGLLTIAGYQGLLARARFVGIEAEDLSPLWIGLVRERMRMHRAMRTDMVARFGQARYDEYGQLHEFFVSLVAAGKLGGARFSGRT